MLLRRRRQRDAFLPWLYLLLDIMTVYAVLRGAFWFRFESGFFEAPLPDNDHHAYYTVFHLSVLFIVFFMRSYGLYRPGSTLSFVRETLRILRAVLISTMILTALSFFMRDFSFSRSFLVVAGVCVWLGITLERWVLGNIVLWVDEKRGSLRNILVIGCEESARRLVRYFANNRRSGRRVVGFLDDHRAKGEIFEGVPVVGRISDLSHEIVTNRMLHEVVLALPDASSEEVLRMIYECEKQMVTFRWVADIFGLITARMGVSYAGNVSLLSFTDSPLSDWENRLLKRLMDVVLSALALIVLSPLFLVLAILVRLDSRGPIFYRQERIGEDGRHFMLLKFRTMKKDAEKETGPVWARENDPRRTRIGSFLRENNLDELPQLWNVLVGDMSLVGPRPERPHFVSQFKEDIPRYMARHSIRSGITGWAQVNGLRGNTSIEERTKFDLFYIENWSLYFDVKILIMTIFARQNAY